NTLDADEMADREIIAHDLVRQKDFTNAINVASTRFRIKIRLIHALYKLKRFQEAEAVCLEWMSCLQVDPEVVKVIDRYKTLIKMINGHKSNTRISIQRLHEEVATIDNKLDTWAIRNMPQDKFSRVMKPFPTSNHTSSKKGLTTDSKIKDKLENTFHKNLENLTINGDDCDVITCTYCAVNFVDRAELRAHCQTESHQKVIMSDEGKFSTAVPPNGKSIETVPVLQT
ncbi:hypothetical protein Bhyg_00613, partial [Pseudolycoriella hygida]